MNDRILVAVDGSRQSEAALEHTLTEFPDAEITVLHVIDPVGGGYALQRGIPTSGEGWYESAREKADDLFADARERAAEFDRSLDTVVEVGRPARTIVEVADEGDYDGIVMGSHGRAGVSRVLLGSVAETVVRRSTVPVTVVR